MSFPINKSFLGSIEYHSLPIRRYLVKFSVELFAFRPKFRPLCRGGGGRDRKTPNLGKLFSFSLTNLAAAGLTFNSDKDINKRTDPHRPIAAKTFTSSFFAVSLMKTFYKTLSKIRILPFPLKVFSFFFKQAFFFILCVLSSQASMRQG